MSAAELRVCVAIVLAAVAAVVAAFSAQPAPDAFDSGPVTLLAAPVGTTP